MREKLQLLSRIIFSPPNPRVSGGSLLHHGGFSLSYGGHPLSYGGSIAPHRLGFGVDYQVTHFHLFPKSPISTVTTRPSLVFIASPPSTPPSQTLHVALSAESLATSPPPSHKSTFNVLLSSCSPAGDLSLAAGFHGMYLNPFSSMSDPLPTSFSRPPPEPPPLALISGRVNPFIFATDLNNHLLPCYHTSEIPPSSMYPIRPPPKPTWCETTISVIAYVLSMACDSVFVVFGRALIGVLRVIKYTVWYNHFWVCVVSLVIFVLDIEFLASKICRFCVDTMMIIKTFSLASFRQTAFVLVVWLDHRETTHSRIGHILAKEMIRNWIDSKTPDSPLIMAIYQGRMLFGWLIGLANWFDGAPLWPILYLYVNVNVMYVLSIRSNSNTCLGNVPTLIDYAECMVYSQLIE